MNLHMYLGYNNFWDNIFVLEIVVFEFPALSRSHPLGSVIWIRYSQWSHMKTYRACFVSIACYVMKVNGLKTEIIAQKIHVATFYIASI